MINFFESSIIDFRAHQGSPLLDVGLLEAMPICLFSYN